jgi:hypothetical protein
MREQAPRVEVTTLKAPWHNAQDGNLNKRPSAGGCASAQAAAGPPLPPRTSVNVSKCSKRCRRGSGNTAAQDSELNIVTRAAGPGGPGQGGLRARGHQS